MGGRLVRGVTAAASVICGAAVGILSILVTGDWSLTWIVAFAVAVVCWITLEVRRAIAEPDSSGERVSVIQRAGTVWGRMIGMRGAMPSTGVDISQEVNMVGEKAEIVGLDGSPSAEGSVDGKTT